MHQKTKILIFKGLLCSVCFALAVQLSGCKEAPAQKAKNEKQKKGSDAVYVETSALQQGPVSAYLQASGVISAKREVTLMSQRAGRIVRVSAEEGDVVKNGQSLGQLDNERETILLRRATLQLERLTKEKSRVQKLVAEKIQSEETLENLNYSMEEATLAVNEAKKNLRETQLRAPFTGVVVKRHWETGATANPAAPAFVLSDFSRLEVRLGIPEDRLANVEKAQRVEVYPLAAPSKTFTGEILRIHPAVNPQSGTVEIVVALKPDAFLKPGMFIRARIHTDHKAQATLAPKKSLLYEDDRAYLFRLIKKDDAMQAEKLYVQPGLSNGDMVEISGDINTSDQIIVQGQSGLKNGTAVKTTMTLPVEDSNDKREKRRYGKRK